MSTVFFILNIKYLHLLASEDVQDNVYGECWVVRVFTYVKIFVCSQPGIYQNTCEVHFHLPKFLVHLQYIVAQIST